MAFEVAAESQNYGDERPRSKFAYDESNNYNQSQ
jgi:hypothetical protein